LTMRKPKGECPNTIYEVSKVVKNYKKRGIATILLTIPQIEELLEAADHQTAEENSTMKYRIVERKDIEKVLDVMKADYFEWTVTRNKLYNSENFNEEDALKGCEEFNKGLTVTEGSRYFRIISNRHGQLHCMGFIVKTVTRSSKRVIYCTPQVGPPPHETLPEEIYTTIVSKLQDEFVGQESVKKF